MTNYKKILAGRAKWAAQVDRMPDVFKAIDVGSDVVIYSPPCTCKDAPCPQCNFAFRALRSKEHTDGLDTFAYTDSLTDKAAGDIIQKYWSSILTTFESVEATITQHGDGILAQWNKADSTLRADLMKSAKPGIHEARWPQVYHCFAIGGDWTTKRSDRDTWLLPYVNVDLLSATPWSVLHLLEQTTSQHPSVWCKPALEPSAIQLGLVAQRFNPGMVHITQDSFGTYEPKLNCQMLHEGRAIGFPYAEVMLESADLLLRFLHRLCQQILAQAGTKSDTGNAKWKKQSTQSFAVAIQDQPFLSHYWSHGYLFNMADIKGIAEARMGSANEEIIAFQTEPQHLQNRIETLQDRNCITRILPEVDRAVHLTWEVFKPAVQRYRVWEALCTRITEYETALASSSLDRDNVVKQTIGQIDQMLASCLHEVSRLISDTLPKVLAFEKRFIYGPHGISGPLETLSTRSMLLATMCTAHNFQSNAVFHSLKMAGNLKMHPFAMRSLTWLPAFATECLDESSIIEKFELSELVEDLGALVHIQKVLENAPTGFDRLKNRERASDLYATLRQAHPEIAKENPSSFLLAAPFTAFPLDALKLESTEVPKPTKHWRPAAGRLRELCKRAQWPDIKGKALNYFKYLSECRTSKLALFQFWDEVRKARASELAELNPIVGTKTQDDAQEKHERRIRKDQEIQLISKGFTKRYTDLVAQENESIDNKVKSLKRQRSEATLGTSSTGTSTSGPATAPKKIKTMTQKQRDSAAAEDAWLKPKTNEDFLAWLRDANNNFVEPDPSPEPSLDLDSDDDYPTAFITGLSKKQHDVIKHLWPHQSHNVAGSVRWDGFQGAMEAAGCTVTATGNGSAYDFEKKEDVLGTGRLTIHRTHFKNGGAVIPQDMLERWGKRITKWLKWRYDSFVDPRDP